MIVLLGIFHISPLLFLLQHEAQCLILLTVVQTGITGEMLIIPFLLEYFPIIYSGFLRERRLWNNEHLCFVGFPLGIGSNRVEKG